MANLKDLAKEKNLFTGGHRACAGCGAAIIARQVMMAAGPNTVVANATGCLEVVSTIFPYTAWEVPFIHSAFENAAATISGVEALYRSWVRQGKYNKKVNFIAFGGDGGTYDIGLQSLSGALERGHNILYVCYDNEAYMNCLSTSSMISTKEGLKKITDVKEGSYVYAFDQKTNDLVLKQCTGIFDNGIKDVYELSTRHHTIKATSNHPFLIVKRNGRGRKTHLIWKTLAELKTGDRVIGLKNVGSGKSVNFGFKKAEKGDYKVNKIKEVDIPRSSSTDLMKYLGIYVGDGWVRSGRAEVGFAVPEGSEARTAVMELQGRLFKSPINRIEKNYLYVNSANVARFIDSMGFQKGAKNKTVPGWVFSLPREEKEGFIEGLMLSDGYQIGKSCRYVSASQDLLKTLRLLLQTIEYRVGKIHQQTKKKGTNCVYRKLLKDSTYGYICFSKKQKPNVEKYPSQCRYRDPLVENEYFNTEEIIGIKLVGKEPTLDLRVEGEHNFIADGIVVHNTGVQRSSATPKGADTTTAPVGKVKKGKEQYRKDLTGIIVAHKIPYVAQSIVGNWRDLTYKVEKALSMEGPKFINVFQPCRLGWAYEPEFTCDIGRMAADTCAWPLYEVVNGQYRITYKPKEKKPVAEWLKLQGRFRHLFKPENKPLLDDIQAIVDKNWEELLTKEGPA
jgi:pyruvate/2-oxoacid:ferredoxin oxidoreductase beta subunit/intein/homing endonuclease